MKRLFLSCAFALFLTVPVPAGIVGDTFHIEWDFPSYGTVLFSTNVIASPTAFWNPDSGVSGISLGDGTLTIANTSTGWTGAAFNGFKFTDTSRVAGFTSFTLVSATGNLPPLAPALSFDANDLIINFTPTGTQNTSTGYGQIYNFAFTTVPEPSAGLLILAAFLALRFLRRGQQSWSANRLGN